MHSLRGQICLLRQYGGRLDVLADSKIKEVDDCQ